MPTIIIGQQPSLKPEQIAPHLTLLWQKFIEQKENDDGLKHYDAFVEHVVGTCTTILELDLFLGLRKTIADFPHLLAEYAENNELLANQVVAGTNKMLKWVCKKCGYPWETTGASRAVGATGCRACANLAVKPDKSNSLAFVRPDLAAEYTDDNELPADEVITGTKTKLKWVCRSCGHRWEATGADRVRGRGCPVCANRVIKPDKSNSLAHTHPHLVAEYADDNELPADQVVAGTNKKLKWVCKK
ncbi:MAG: zinc-ribbon domain-containing protein, partial [bacterium]|nr:zinc-ribbon domain-containing protein [bacterium]